MIPEETVVDALRVRIDQILQIPNYAYRDKQKDAPRPQGPYCTINYATDAPVGHSEILRTDENYLNMRNTNSGHVQLMISLNFYRDGALNNAKTVRRGVYSENSTLHFNGVGIGLARVSQVRKTSETMEDNWESRAQLDLFFNAVEEYSETVEAIEQTSIGLTVDSDSTTFNETIEVGT